MKIPNIEVCQRITNSKTRGFVFEKDISNFDHYYRADWILGFNNKKEILVEGKSYYTLSIHKNFWIKISINSKGIRRAVFFEGDEFGPFEFIKCV